MSKFLTVYEPPEKRRDKAEGGIEERLTEASIMLAISFHLLEEDPAATITICPDGEHAKWFDIRGWLEAEGFERTEPVGKTEYGGKYVRHTQSIVVNPRSGIGDVSGDINGASVFVECKGGTINSKHPGQVSRLRRGLCEAVGLLMARPLDGAREIAAVPWTSATERLAKQMAPRCSRAGIELALVQRNGEIVWIDLNQEVVPLA